ncbi:hypothetical protein L1887_28077 [Cichorium endivia]|nr:hypothetical protein L1887_28077 [Cichorium endivia]
MVYYLHHDCRTMPHNLTRAVIAHPCSLHPKPSSTPSLQRRVCFTSTIHHHRAVFTAQMSKRSWKKICLKQGKIVLHLRNIKRHYGKKVNIVQCDDGWYLMNWEPHSDYATPKQVEKMTLFQIGFELC